MSVHTTVDTRSPTTTTSTSTSTTLRRLEQALDAHTVETQLQAYLTRRRRVRRARREQAIAQARHENELLMQRTLFSAGLLHLR